MLVSVVVQLKPVKAGRLPATTGPAIHGLFFQWLSSVAPTLATELHDLPGLKPFSVSNLQLDENRIELSQLTHPDLYLHIDKTYCFRLTSTDLRLSKTILEHLYSTPPPTFDILGRVFTVQKVIADSSQHPWARIISWQDLVGTNLFETKAAVKAKARKIKLFFYSPTSFKSAGKSLPIPLPEQTFGGLAARWNAFSPVPLDESFQEYVVQSLAVSAYDLHTELVLLEGSQRGTKMVCFRGWCEYTSLVADSEYDAVLKMLGEFAFFTGVGHRASMGFGQTLSC